MDPSLLASTSSFGETISDRLTVSCPPETCTSADAEHLDEFPSLTPNQIEQRREPNNVGDLGLLPFKKERPERPGETESAYESATISRACSTLLEEGAEDEGEATPETDRFGFFLGQDGLPPSIEPAVDVEKLRSREMKWIHMMDNWRYFMDEKYTTVRKRCRKGIPPSVRGKAWKYLCGATYQMEVSTNRTVFDRCLDQAGDPKWIDDIEKDLNRQFPNHEMFSRYGKYGDGGDAFYCFVQVCHRYLPDYYSPGLEAVQVDGDILVQLLKDKSRVTYQHLKKHNVEPVLYMVEWFMCIFCRTLPWPTVLRVWDMFFCEGAKVLFKVALVLFKYGLGTKEQCKQYPDLHSIVTRLRNLPPQITTEEFLVEKVCDLNLNDADLEKIHFRALKLRQIKIAQR
ncbi:TBC domain protein [Ancylostoma ceylanicum]|uniref:TBC domain protein n=1 Tax=Ancylostoma ceylanicum TaxID=53326 RepID=A0A0D6LR53_9BILA|nr:TBC domain protein [Ancylostoma ceylanicum]